MSRRKLGISVSKIESHDSFRTGHGQSQIQCTSESVARHRGQRQFVDILHDVGQWFPWVYWFRLLVRVRSIGAAVVVIGDGGEHVVVIGD